MHKANYDGDDRSAQRRKRHHYVPESYLKAWTDQEGQVAVRRRDKELPFRASTRNVAVEADLYAFSTDAGIDDTMEVALSRIESPLSNHIASVREKGAPRKNSIARTEISFLLALQLVRTPERLDRIMFPIDAANFTGERPVSFEGMRRFLRKYLGEPPTDSEIRGALDFTNYVLSRGEVTKREAFHILVKSAEEQLAPRLAAMAWSVEKSPLRTFITTDRPVVLWRRRPQRFSGVGLDNADEVWFPLGPHHLLVLRPRHPERRYVIEEARHQLVNRHIASACYKMIIGIPEDLDYLRLLPLQTVRPAMRFNTGPLLEVDSRGKTRTTGHEILHTFVPYNDEG
ncbi:DUF4238 domain-containing protein [Actinomadura luzonensis]|uniref:DUF4238 domain-containing protein n=1 Tax=Actinomadura luzonensis TaxID=2805427 RepID=UPI003899503B